MEADIYDQLSSSMQELVRCEAEPIQAERHELAKELAALASLQRIVRIALSECATDLREAGASWREIGEATGTTMQNAHARWGKQKIVHDTH